MLRVLLSVGLFAVLFIYITLLNPQTVRVALTTKYAFTLPLSVLIVVTAAVGFVVAYIMGLLRDVRLVMLKSELRKQGKNKSKIVESLKVGRRFGDEASVKYLENVRVGKDPYLLGLYGALLRETGDVEQAKEIHADLRIKEEDRIFLAEFLWDLHAEGRDSEVLAIVKDLSPSDITPSVAMVAAEAALALGEYKLAEFAAERLFRMVPVASTESFLLGVKTERLKASEDTKGLKKLLKKKPGFIPAIEALIELEDVASALGALREAYRETKDPTYVFWLIDVVVKREGADPGRTMEFIRKAIPEKDETASLIVAYLYAKLGMYEEALKMLGESETSDTGLARYVRFLALRGLGRYEEASRVCEELAERGAYSYVCGVCGSRWPVLYGRCRNCNSYDSIRLEV